jgi:hypothetical protein
MFDGIDEQRLVAMTDQERRWLDNVKKAFADADKALQSSTPEDGCLEALFKGIDTAKTLRRSLRGEDTSGRDNKARFIEFVGLEIPAAQPGSSGFMIPDESGTLRHRTLGEVLYLARCKIHENENLDAAEQVSYPILLTGIRERDGAESVSRMDRSTSTDTHFESTPRSACEVHHLYRGDDCIGRG